jgi:MFS transporter, DHA2 family, multidrug resistance protein
LERTLERNRQLFYQGKGVISKQDLDNAQSQARQQNSGGQSPVTPDPKFRLGFGSKLFAGGKLIRFRVSFAGYLEQVQNYSARQTGEAMVLIGLPQLLIFPIVPCLMQKFDLRLIIFVGALVFGGSCLLNIRMNPEFGGPQFQFANIIRALGQPFTIVPLSALATVGLLREQQGDGSALFNIMRNLGGSVGTALLSTMITQREQFHDFRIGERVTAYNPYVQQFLTNQSVQNLRHSGDPVAALQQAYRMLQASVQTNSYVMAYSECFLLHLALSSYSPIQTITEKPIFQSNRFL